MSLWILLFVAVCGALPTPPNPTMIGTRNMQLVYAHAIPSDESMVPAETFWGGYNGYGGGRTGWKSDAVPAYASVGPMLGAIGTVGAVGAVGGVAPVGAVYPNGEGLFGGSFGWKDSNGGRVEHSGWRGDSAGAWSSPTTYNSPGPGWRN
ncbi:uncharacterized protein LOC109604882 [Aethina tumida]|uniref:uncharacterized protein LOC109604882 n=1 Tax=Aethina tumida TaxID=116153 RepID=UPI00096B06E6|nr:uncharacterized protein LOC109604882 [Aethina tumida]